MKQLYIICLIHFNFTVFSQNLIENPNFEPSTHLNSYQIQLSRADQYRVTTPKCVYMIIDDSLIIDTSYSQIKGWTDLDRHPEESNITISDDDFFVCMENSYSDTSGSFAFNGFYFPTNTALVTGCRFIVELEQDKKYKLSFKIKPDRLNALAFKTIQLKLSDHPFTFESYNKDSSELGSIDFDKDSIWGNWKNVTFYFDAKGKERYLYLSGVNHNIADKDISALLEYRYKMIQKCIPNKNQLYDLSINALGSDFYLNDSILFDYYSNMEYAVYYLKEIELVQMNQ